MNFKAVLKLCARTLPDASRIIPISNALVQAKEKKEKYKFKFCKHWFSDANFFNQTPQ
jgi:hypothetical protein